MKQQGFRVTNNEGESIHFFDNTYGDMGVVIKGPRGGHYGDFLLSPHDVQDLIHFFKKWLQKAGNPQTVKVCPNCKDKCCNWIDCFYHKEEHDA